MFRPPGLAALPAGGSGSHPEFEERQAIAEATRADSHEVGEFLHLFDKESRRFTGARQAFAPARHPLPPPTRIRG